MRQNETLTITNDGKDFNLLITQLKPSDSLKILVYLGKVLGGTAGKALGAIDTKKLADVKEEDISLEKLGDALTALLDRIDEDAICIKLNELFKSVSLNGSTLDLDNPCFQGRPDLIFVVAKKAMEVNFKSFLDANSGVVGKIIESLKIIRKVQE